MIDIDRVSHLIKDVAAELILPRWQKLVPDEIMEKAPGDLVTIADREAELRITAALKEILPGVPVIGEEAVAAKPELLREIHNLSTFWLVDPIDGTQNFVRGDHRFAVMVCLIRDGITVGSWIYLPVSDRMAVAERGSGTCINGERRLLPAPPTQIEDLVAAAHIKRLPEPLKHQVQERLKQFGVNRPAFCAGYDYMALLDGKRHFLLYNRTLPWDHAPGVLLATEAGGNAARFDGGGFDPLAIKDMGLLVAPDRKSWSQVRDVLFPAQG